MSKASHSAELVTRINHADINCGFFTRENHGVYRAEESLPPLINGIGDYLMKVLGSVPIGLKITLRVHDESRYPNPVIFGPVYYEEAMSESEEEG